MTDGGITVITPTGDRPFAFSLLRDRWMPAQRVQPDQWIIVDDGDVPYDTQGLPDYADYVRRSPSASIEKIEPGDEIPKKYVKLRQHTLGANLIAALDRVKCEHIFIMEDDDYYSPFYLAYMSGLINGHDCVGLWGTPYWHVLLMAYRVMSSRTGAALARMGFKKSFIPSVQKVCAGDVSIDSRICRRHRPHLVDGRHLNLHCSIKGMPGRRGAGVGHVNKNYTPDPDCVMLKRWCGEDAKVYLDLMERGFV